MRGLTKTYEDGDEEVRAVDDVTFDIAPGTAILVGTGVGYLLAGYLVFLKASAVARKRSVLGHY